MTPQQSNRRKQLLIVGGVVLVVVVVLAMLNSTTQVLQSGKYATYTDSHFTIDYPKTFEQTDDPDQNAAIVFASKKNAEQKESLSVIWHPLDSSTITPEFAKTYAENAKKRTDSKEEVDYDANSNPKRLVTKGYEDNETIREVVYLFYDNDVWTLTMLYQEGTDFQKSIGNIVDSFQQK